MKAAQRIEYGNSEVISVAEVEIPEPAENEILVRVHATTVNRTDCAILTASLFIMRLITGVTRPKFPGLGTDFAGVVEKTGSGVGRFQPGDRVWGFNDSCISSQAEYMTLSEKDSVDVMPENIDFITAAASIEGAHYARNFLNKVHLEQGQRALVNGGTGAIGSAMVQMLRSEELRVTAVCRAEHDDVIRRLGADDIVDYQIQDFTQTDKKFDYVFDTVGKSTFGKCKKILTPKGIYISSELGPYGQNPFFAIFTPLTSNKTVKFPFPSSPLESLKYSGELLEKGQFSPLIDRIFPLEEVAEAYKYVLTGQKVGNVVLSIT